MNQNMNHFGAKIWSVFANESIFFFFSLDIFVLVYLIIMKYHELRNVFVFGVFTVSVCLCALTQPKFSTFHFWEKAVAHGFSNHISLRVSALRNSMFSKAFSSFPQATCCTPNSSNFAIKTKHVCVCSAFLIVIDFWWYLSLAPKLVNT